MNGIIKQMLRSCEELGIDIGNQSQSGLSTRYPSQQDGLAFKAANGGGGILRTQVCG